MGKKKKLNGNKVCMLRDKLGIRGRIIPFAFTVIFLLIVVGTAYATDCQREQGIDVGSDCNIFVAVSSDVTSVDLNVWDVNGIAILSNASMFSCSSGVFYTHEFSAHGNPSEFFFRVVAVGDNTKIGAGSFYSVDLNLDSRITDANATVQNSWTDINGGIGTLLGYTDTLESGQTTITGNQSTMQTYLTDINTVTYDTNGNVNIDLNIDLYDVGAKTWGYSPRTLTDNNQDLTFTYLGDINLVVWDINKNINTDLNSDLYNAGGGATAAQIWGYGTRTLTDYNQSGTINMWQHLYDINLVSWDINENVNIDLNVDLYNVADVNATADVDNNAIAAAVWDFNTTTKIDSGKFRTMRELVQIIYEVLVLFGG